MPVERSCQNCGKTFHVPPRRAMRAIACSNACRGILQRNVDPFPLEELLRRLETNSIPIPFAGCQAWLAGTTNGGYGVMYVGGPPRGSMQLAHRISYELYCGPIPDGLEPDHLCRVRCCVNPLHLEAVTRAENIRRGIGGRHLGAAQSAKTHCPQGHPYDIDNTVIRRGKRVCRECERTYARIWQQRKRTQQRAQRTPS